MNFFIFTLFFHITFCVLTNDFVVVLDSTDHDIFSSGNDDNWGCPENAFLAKPCNTKSKA